MEINQTVPTSATEDFSILRVGLCQVYTEPWAVEANLSRTIEAIEAAAARGAQVAVTPEAVLQGYPEHDAAGAKEKFGEWAELLDGGRLATLRNLAHELAIHLVVGFVEAGPDGRFYNSSALISPGGAFLHNYRKVHCRIFEDRRHEGFYSPGDRFYVSELQADATTVKAGTMICFDREITESVRCLRSLGAEIIFCPLATDTADLSAPSTCVDNEYVTRVRAAENEVFIVVVNHAGRYNGGSFVVGPEGEVLCQMNSEAGVEVVDVPVGVITSRFHNRPYGEMGWEFRRPEVYQVYF